MTPLQKDIFTAECAENAEIFLTISQKNGFFFADFALFKLCALRVLSGKGFLQ